MTSTTQTRQEIEAEISRLQNKLAEAARQELLNAIASIKEHVTQLGVSKEVALEALLKVVSSYDKRVKANPAKGLGGKMSVDRYNGLSEEDKAKYDAKKPGHPFKNWQ
jgi:hypothetical protein